MMHSSGVSMLILHLPCIHMNIQEAAASTEASLKQQLKSEAETATEQLRTLQVIV